MPRTKKRNQPTEVVVETAHQRKPRTTDLDERLAMANAEIDRLTKLNEERRILIEKTRAKLSQRENALLRSEEQLEKVLKKRARIEKQKSKPALRESKATEKAQMQALLEAIRKSGKSIEEVMKNL